ncbi:arginine--tRNA ligase [Allokutzneria sp. A3M-2-11 16]|uniref:arginine--tRNA ligase n=1 Tax=Allokutzneria sp. A3M-2-11 16 TaxID=2962043 RepID=UPI0020B6645A|nr:arginine--tRNA ligase [Allokutzneria sp. A3M-2-11 16]MCP3802070.1 arginine--tRNA ligase [Allokutzneria sp. A3M-2-11 16]
MHPDIGLELGARVARAVQEALEVRISPAEALVRPSARADYQCNAAMGLGKRLGRPPREIAELIVAHLDAADMVEPPEVAGPGFVNFTLRAEWLSARAADLLTDPRCGVRPADQPRRYVVDYGGPNVAKEMHVGHLRSSVIGDAIARMLDFAGHEVIRRNHLGDWGTPFGMLIEHLASLDAGAELSIGDLNGFYQEARKKFDADPEFASRARTRVVALQSGDPATLALWRGLVEESERHFAKVYEQLGVLLSADDSYGESFYNPMLADTVAELEAKGLTEVSDGAVCVFPPGFTNRDGERLPLIVRKSDGGYMYASTDLAAVRYWTQERGATDLVYVVGTPQSQHFQMVFRTASAMGWLDASHRAVHVNFGSVLGEDGKMLRTRAGGSIKLADLLTEAVERADGVRAVGIGAVKYADLSSDRQKDYVFAWDKMLAKEGNTSVYLQYAVARVSAVMAQAKVSTVDGSVLVTHKAERALLVKLLQLPAALAAALEDFAPHRLCSYLYETAVAFSSFYENCPILKAEPDLRESRLALAQLTSRVLTKGLDLLGIEAPVRL